MSLTANDHDSEAHAAVAGPAPRRRRMLRGLLVAVAVLAITIVAAATAACRVPEFYRQRIAAGDADSPAAEQSARRLVSDISALHASFIREG